MRHLLLVLTLLALGTAAEAAQEAPAPAPLGLLPSQAFLRDQVAEPVFAWVFALVDADSLGVWTAADVEAFAAAWTAPSAFPLGHLAGFRREAVPAAERIERAGLVCDRRVVIDLDASRLDMAMPYSILGYHPGTLSFGSPVIVNEWRPGRREVAVRGAGGARRDVLHGLVVFEIVSGWTVLDVDGWLDTLLGAKLDDAATVGFGVARGAGGLIAVGNSIGREGRFIFGEMDLRANTIAPHGQPLARAMASLVRRWSDPETDARTAVWDGYDRPSP